LAIAYRGGFYRGGPYFNECNVKVLIKLYGHEGKFLNVPVYGITWAGPYGKNENYVGLAEINS